METHGERPKPAAGMARAMQIAICKPRGALEQRSRCSVLSIVKQGDLMVVANVGDSRVVLGTAFDDDAITSSSSSST
uniref:protein-serine/threonine phosphatase n=1 Tax=Zea mays TaxID=4577 RepID=A0A804UMP1_MAIZE